MDLEPETPPEATEKKERAPWGALRDAILDNMAKPEDRRLSWVDLAKKLDISPTTVRNRAYMLRREGRVKPRKTHRNMRTVNQSEDKLIELLTSEGGLTDAVKHQILEDLAINGSEAGRARAIQIHNEMVKSAGSDFGPPPPTKPEDQTHRLGQLMSMLPRDVVTRAYNNWLSEATSEQKASETSN